MTRCLDCPALISRGSRCRNCTRAQQRRRNERRGGSGWEWERTRQRILERDGFACQAPGFIHSEGPLEVDHITPLAEGGTNYDSNLITRCHLHHSAKTTADRRRQAGVSGIR